MKNIDSAERYQANFQNENYKKKTIPLLDNTVSIDVSKVFFIFLSIGTFLFALSLFFIEKNSGYEESDVVAANFAHNCEKGEWIEVPMFFQNQNDESENIDFKGVIFAKDSDMTNAEQDMNFAVHPEYSLMFFDSRNVEIIGKRIDIENEEKIYVEKIRCVGNDASQTVQRARQEKMQFIAQNKQEIFELSESDAVVDIEDISFVQENIMYVYFVETKNEYGVEKLLVIRIDEDESGYTAHKLSGYDLVDKKFILANGVDKYTHSRKITYEYNDNLDLWVLVW